jgi:beta-phosphoglucomutase-like phosphatase (HAD superfamily)
MLALLQLRPEVPVITRDQVERAKPDPDLFLAAAKRLGVPATQSIVVGDSVWDLLAAPCAKALGVGVLSGGYGQDELERARPHQALSFAATGPMGSCTLELRRGHFVSTTVPNA